MHTAGHDSGNLLHLLLQVTQRASFVWVMHMTYAQSSRESTTLGFSSNLKP